MATSVTGPSPISVQGRYAYVVGNDGNVGKGFEIFDLSNPSSVSMVGTAVNPGGAPTGIYVQGRYAYVVYGNGIFAIYDVSTPTNPQVLGMMNSGLTSPSSIAVSGRYAYVTYATGLATFDLGGTYSQQVEAGGIEAGTVQVDSTLSVAGNTNLQGGITVGQAAKFDGNVGITGNMLINNASTTGFLVQNTSNQAVVTADTSGNQLILGAIGSVNGKLQFSSAQASGGSVSIIAGAMSSAASYTLTLPTTAPSTNQCLLSGSTTATSLTFGSCSLARSKKIVLTAEYAGAVLDAGTGANNSGTMTSGNDLTNRENYYKWTTSVGTSQSYDIDVQVPIPSDFGSWASSTPITVDTYTHDISNGLAQIEARDTTGALEASCNFVGITPTVADTWQSRGNFCTIAGTYTAGGFMTLRIRLYAVSSVTPVRSGNITLNYTSAY